MSRTITANYPTGITLTNTGDNPVVIGSGVTLASASGTALQSNQAYYWTITNTAGANINGDTFGVSLANAGSFVNNGGITSSYSAGKGFSYNTATHAFTVLSASLFLGGGSVTNTSTGIIGGGVEGVALGGAGTVFNAGSIGAPVTNAGFGVALAAGGAVTNQSGGAISGTLYGVFSDGTSSLSNQTNATITGSRIGLLGLNGVASVNNQGTLSGGGYGIKVSGSAGTIANQGLISGTNVIGIYLVAGGNVANSPAASIIGGYDGVLISKVPGAVTNQGTIRNLVVATTQTFTFGGVILAAGGSISNSGTGLISSSSYGAWVYGSAGTVVNAGTISSSRTMGGAGIALLSGGTVTNTGLVTGEWIGVQSGAFGGYSPAAAKPVTFDNSGTISAADGKGDGAAVWVHGPGVVINRAGGVIEGSTNGLVVGGPLNGLLNGGFGVVAYYQTTVVNYGSIGGAAYAFDAAGTGTTVGNRIEIAPGGTFGGVVLGAHTPTQAKYSTLELMSGASVGTINGFGTQYKNFGNVTIDDGARWSFGGAVASTTTIAFAANGAGLLSLANPGAMQGTIAGFQAGDTLAAAGIAVTGLNYSGGVLTLIEASGSVSLNLPGTFATNQFAFANDSGGTAITIPPRTLTWTGNGASSAFGTAANWNDVSNGLNPALNAPNAGDTITFNASNGGVTGTGSVSVLDVGSVGSGVLQLDGGATIVTGSPDAGVIASSVGQVGLTGAGTTMIVTGNAIVADGGTGVLSVLNGATFDAGSLTIGSQGNSSGALIVSGAGSVINLVGALNIGTALGIGDLTVGPGAAVHAGVVNLQGQVVLEGGLLDPTVTIINQGQTAGGNGTLQAGDIIDEGVIQAGGTKPSQRLLVVQGTVLGGGTLTINGTVQPSNPAGVLQINASGTMELTGPVLNAATTTFTDNLAQPGTYTVNNSVVDVTFADALGVLLLDDIAGFGGTITSFKGGDSFVITGGTLSNLGVSNSNTLTFSDTGVNAGSGGIDQIIFGSAVSAANFNIVNGNTVQVACFAAGTRIATMDGPIAVEDLAIGDQVLTFEGRYTAIPDQAPTAGRSRHERIAWIGSRFVNCAAHPAPATVWPVRVSAGAFGPGLPEYDLFLSPDHAVFVTGVLVPVKLLVNGASIVQVKRDQVRYFHVELPRHDVILAEGLPVESYLDIGDRANFGGDVTRLFPDFMARFRPDAAWAWETKGAAKFVTGGAELAAAKRVVRKNAPLDRLIPATLSPA